MITFLLAAGLLQATPEVTIAEKSRTALEITVYHEDSAFVSDRRKAALPAGRSTLKVEGLLGRPDIDAVVLRVPGEKEFRVIRQTVLPVAVDTQTLLRQSVGRWVLAVRTNPESGKDEVEAAELLSIDGGLVLRADKRIDTAFPGRIALTDLPPGTRSQASVEAEVSLDAGANALVLSYLTGGLGWQASYVAVENEDGTLDFRAFGTVRNDTAVSLRDVSLRLVAGTVRREVSPEPHGGMTMKMMAVREAAPLESSFSPLGDYQVFDLGETSLAPNGANQFSLFSAPAVKYEKRYVLQSQVMLHHGQPDEWLEARNPLIRMRVVNTAENGLGVPFPQGMVR